MGAQGSRGAGGGAPSPDEPAGFVTVSEPAARAEAADPDLEMLRRLPPVAPLIPLPTMRGLFAAAGGASGASAMDELNRLRADSVVDICHSYVGLSHQAIVPLCEGQKALARKMSGVEALCARILYLLALRANELSGCASALSDVGQLHDRLAESKALLHRTLEQAAQLEATLDALCTDAGLVPGPGAPGADEGGAGSPSGEAQSERVAIGAGNR